MHQLYNQLVSKRLRWSRHHYPSKTSGTLIGPQFNLIPPLQAQKAPPGRTQKRRGKKRGAKRHVKDLTKTSYPFVFNWLRFNRNPMFPHSHAGNRGSIPLGATNISIGYYFPSFRFFPLADNLQISSPSLSKTETTAFTVSGLKWV